MGNSWITHEGKKIFFIDCKDLNEEDFIKTFSETDVKAEELVNSVQGGVLLTLMDFTGVVVTKEIRRLGEKVNAKYKKLIAEKGMTQHICVVGISGLKKTIISLINRDVHYVDTLEEGKDWLVNQ